MREVTPLRAARVVMPSKVSPGPDPYIGWKWSKPHTPSKPRSSASFTRRTTSSQLTRCWATSSPNLMSCPLLRLSSDGRRCEFRDPAVEAPGDAVVVQYVVIAADEGDCPFPV